MDPAGPYGGAKFDMQAGDSCTVKDTSPAGWEVIHFNNRMELADTGGAELVGRQQGGSVQQTITDLPEAFVDDHTPSDGTIRINAQPADGTRLDFDIKTETVKFEFTSGGGAGAGNFEVVKGVDEPATAAAFAAVLDNVLGGGGLGVMFFMQHGTDTTVIDWLGQVNPIIANTTGGAVVDHNRSQGKTAERTTYFHRSYLVDATDVDNGHLMLFLGPSLGGNVTGSFRVRTAVNDNTEVLYNGIISWDSGYVDFDDSGITKLAAGNVVDVWGKATYG